MSESLTRIFIYTHATLGGIALLSGFISLLTPKGNRLHKKGGIIFYYTMVSSAILAMIISVQPNHVNYFLFVIGVFSAYMTLTGKRILALKGLYRKVQPARIDYALPGTMMLTAILMVIYGIIMILNGNNNGIVLVVFGIIAALMAAGDFRMLKKPPEDKRFWLYKHITKMTGGYIAAFTAFLVVNNVLPGLWSWLTPTVIGTIYITYHQVRFRRMGEKILASRNIPVE